MSVSGTKSELGEQIVGPSRDHPACRSTCVQLARRIGQNSWRHFFKSSWSYKAQEHEGNVLQKLKCISDICWGLRAGCTQQGDLDGGMSLHKLQITYSHHLPQASFSKSLPTSTTNEAPRRNSSADQFRARELRHTVTKYVYPRILRLDLSRLTRPIVCLAKFISKGSFRGRTPLGSL